MASELPTGWAQVTERSFTDGTVRVDARDDVIEFGAETAPDEWLMVPVPTVVIQAALQATVARSPVGAPCFCSPCFRGDPEHCGKVAWIARLRDEGYTVLESDTDEPAPNRLREHLEAEGLMKYVDDPKLAYREGLAEGNRIRLASEQKVRNWALWFFGGFIVIYLLLSVFSGWIIRP